MAERLHGGDPAGLASSAGACEGVGSDGVDINMQQSNRERETRALGEEKMRRARAADERDITLDRTTGSRREGIAIWKVVDT